MEVIQVQRVTNQVEAAQTVRVSKRKAPIISGLCYKKLNPATNAVKPATY